MGQSTTVPVRRQWLSYKYRLVLANNTTTTIKNKMSKTLFVLVVLSAIVAAVFAHNTFYRYSGTCVV